MNIFDPNPITISQNRPRRHYFFREISNRKDIFRHIPPNWFASVMGLGILANSTVSLPFTFPGSKIFATVIWGLNSIWLSVLIAGTITHWTTHPKEAKSHLTHPVLSNFLGAVSMALLTVGNGTLIIGQNVIGYKAALNVDKFMWCIGTVIGLAAAVWVPYSMITKYDLKADSAFGGWLMPVVSPMVSAAAGATLIPHLNSLSAKTNMLTVCYMFFGLTLLSAFPIIVMLWSKLIQHGPGPAAMVPTMWIVLGPIGQSATAIQLLGEQSKELLPAPYAAVFEAVGPLYAAPMLGFALFWICISSLVTLRTFRTHLPFALTWWSFTFPVGTCVTGMSTLAAITKVGFISYLSGALYLLLLLACITVGIRTFQGLAITGKLLLP